MRHDFIDTERESDKKQELCGFTSTLKAKVTTELLG